MELEFLPLRIKCIVEKLALLRQCDANYQVFGAQAHRYTMNPVLTVMEIAVMTTRLNFQLPEEYVEFICQIGNGGAGPESGLFSLQESFVKSGESDLGNPFPYLEPWQPLFGGYNYEDLRKAGKLEGYMNSYLSEENKGEYDLWTDEYQSESHTNGLTA